MSRRLPPFASKMQFYRLNSSVSSSTPPPISPRNLSFQEHRTPIPHLKPSPSPPIPLEELISSYRKSRPHPQRQQNPETPTQKPVAGYSEAYDDIFQLYVNSCSPHDAQGLHLQLIKYGFLGDTFFSNTLINSYVKSGKLGFAHHIFDQMPVKNSVSWTCLISGYAKGGLLDEACNLFGLMLSLGFAPTNFTYGSMLQVCQSSGPSFLDLGTQIHAFILKTGYSLDPVVCNALISMYGSCCLGSLSYARQVFDSTPSRNSISWNSIISVYCQRGHVTSAFELLSCMQKIGSHSGLSPNEYTFGSLITATCLSSSSDCSSSCVLDQMLSWVAKSGFLGDLYVGSALVNAFARLGLLDKAKMIFLQMDEINAVSVNGLMVGLVTQKLGEEAMEVFREMNDLIVKNCDSYVVLLSACAEFLIPEEGRRIGREVHGVIIRTGLIDQKVAVGNGLVNMYAKCHAMNEARQIFEHMRVRDLVSWNTIISGLDQNRHFEETLMTFFAMRRSGMMPSKFTLISTLSSCASLRFSRVGAQVHCDGIKSGLDFDVSVSNSVLNFYGECNFTSECWKVFVSMPAHDLVSWNSIIGALACSEAYPSESVAVFLDMMRNGWNPNRITFLNIFAALSVLSVHDLGSQVHTLVLKYGVSEDVALENALLSCYAKCGEVGPCERLFAHMSIRRDGVAWNSMIAGYVHNGLLSKAMDCVWFMLHNGLKMDHFTFATVLSACASVAALERGMEIHAFGIRSCLDSDIVVESALVDMYSKCGRIDYASSVFRHMHQKNEFSWNSMISGYARHGHAKKALDMFTEMQRAEQRPDPVTFVGVLSACSHVGWVRKGFEYFESMSKHHGLVPRMEHYSCMVDLLARAGRLVEMEGFIKRMPVEPNALVWRTVLGACCRAKDGSKMDLAKQAGEMLLELDPQNPVNYVLISNMYASRGRWEDVAKSRATMKAAPVRKEAGCSWVNFKDGVHVFVAGDKSHPSTEGIYAQLYLLNQKMRDAGYVPQTRFALYDVDEENKEELLSYHSEKLAVAFVLTRPSGLPIRIMKNLRVCGDCHLAFQYISKIVGRQIVLRDSSRFHHFEDGRCSCGDYW